MQGNYYRLYQSDLVVIFYSKWPPTDPFCLNAYTHMMVKVNTLYIKNTLLFDISNIFPMKNQQLLCFEIRLIH